MTSHQIHNAPDALAGIIMRATSMSTIMGVQADLRSARISFIPLHAYLVVAACDARYALKLVQRRDTGARLDDQEEPAPDPALIQILSRGSILPPESP